MIAINKLWGKKNTWRILLIAFLILGAAASIIFLGLGDDPIFLAVGIPLVVLVAFKTDWMKHSKVVFPRRKNGHTLD